MRRNKVNWVVPKASGIDRVGQKVLYYQNKGHDKFLPAN